MSALLEQPTKLSATEALPIAQEIVDVLEEHCEVRAGQALIIVAGSLRRRKPFVSDIEILFVPKVRAARADDGPAAFSSDLFRAPAPVNEAEIAIANLLRLGLLAKRPNVNGIEAWGAKNKLGVHGPSGMPVDLFTATSDNWFNYLVCRTGGAMNNVRICEAAIAKGWKWNPYGSGFSRPKGLSVEHHVVTSEREVFEFVGLPYLEPWKR